MTASSQTPQPSGPTPPEFQPRPLHKALPGLVHVPASEAAAAVIAATMEANAAATGEDLAQAEQRAGLLFDPVSVDAAVRASAAQARAEAAAEISELRRQRDAVLRLCEGRRGDDLLLVSAVAAAAECGTTALDGFPMALTWTRTTAVPTVDARTGRAVVHCATPYGGRADLVVEDVERQALAAALDTPVPGGAPCPHAADCGTTADLDGSDPVLFGWSRLDVAGSGDGSRWYCSPACVSRALARAGAELAAADALFPGAGADEATCVGCGCTEDTPCPGGCYWVHTASMSDLCSACASPQQLAAAAALVAGEER
ncbi:hypothetical protein AB0M23_21010 [Streptomyces sp. NPDC052077]|uniref:hypothetical protein n=1 Tax=Streptomyces sp. NPDC052077 TaxID=3154757 RepID=UPI00342D1D92